MFRVKVRALPRVLGLAIGLFATSVVTSTAFAAAGDASRAGASAGASPSSSSGAEPAVAVQGGFPGIHVMPGMPGYAQTRLGYLHYWSLGEGPAVLLLHGGPMFAVQYAKVMPLLAQAGFRAIAADLPGYGLSQLPDHPPSGEEYADALGQLLDQLRVKRANVVGMLTGGVVSLAFATHQSARTRCLVLQNTPLYSEEELAAQLAAPAPDTPAIPGLITTLPVYRQVYEVGAWDRAETVLAGGQSGHPLSRLYDDQVMMWREGVYHLMPWSRAAVEKGTEYKLVLQP